MTAEPGQRDDRPAGPNGRAVILVGNTAAPYSRSLRFARTLVGAGYDVEIAAVAGPGLPEREHGEGWTLRRYAASGPWARMSPPTGPGASGVAGRPSIRRRIVGLAAAIRRWIFWPHTVRGWWATLDRALEPADLYHACGSLTVSAALWARDRTPVGPSGRRAVVIYDAIDDVFESNNVLDMPAVLRRWHRRRETRWARSADALLTVNEPLAERLGARWGRRPVAIPNYPDVPSDAAPTLRADPIRAATGLPATTRTVLFQGRLGPRLGLDDAAEAVLQVPATALVLLGFGRWFERERARDADPRFAGRHFTLEARHPDELLAWTAAADVAIVPLPPVSINQRLSAPNKFWEALVAGTPVVVPAGLTYMADIVATGDLGVVARGATAEALADGITEALARSEADPGWRERIRATAASRYSWAAVAATYRALVAELAR